MAFLRIVLFASFVGVALAGEWNCADTSGVFTQSTDCTVGSQIVVTGSLNITGVPDAQGNLPKIIGGGSNRLFKVDSGGELVLKSLNLTGGVRNSGTVAQKSGGAVLVTGATSKAIVSENSFQRHCNHRPYMRNMSDWNILYRNQPERMHELDHMQHYYRSRKRRWFYYRG
eukprot:g3599.t1